MEKFFEDWKSRSSDVPSVEITPIDHSTINKNDKNVLKTILLKNHIHNKKPLEDKDFELETNLFKKITPFTTNKSDIFKKLEEERQQYIKELKAKEDK